jgi:hypothetical protein
MTVTVLIAWAALSVGIVIGAAWRSLCEKQLRSDTSLPEGSTMPPPLPVTRRSWDCQLDRADARRRPAC